MYAYTSALCSGSPHSSHSITVSGSDGSRIVVSASTNGTSARMPANSSGARFATAPISRPPAEPPSATMRSARRVAAVDEVPGAVDEVRERVALVQQLAVLVPLPAHLAAAAHVRDGEDHAAVELRQARDREAGLDRVLVRAVAVEVQRPRRGAGVAERALPDERDRNLRAVLRGRPHPRLRVVGGVVAAEHRLALAQQQLAGRDLVVEHGARA